MNHAIESTRLVTFRVGEHLFAAEINAVQRVLRYEAPRALPDMPDWMEGVVDYQGAMVPVIDMRRRFGLPADAPGQHARLMVCAAPRGLAAMLVDAVLDVKPIQPSDLMDPPELFRGLGGEYLKGLIRRQGQLVVVLDVESLLSSQAPFAFSLMAPRPDRPRTPSALAAPLTGRSARLNASTHIEKGWNLISRGEHAAAEEELQKALKLVPDDTQAASLLGWAQMLQGKYDDALFHFHEVLQREPAHAIARVNVGYICLKKSIYGEAIEHLSRAIRDSSDRKATLYANFYLGLLYSSREMYADAESFLGRALALGPNLIEAYFELGRARWFGGNAEGARQAWRDGAAAGKFNSWGQRCAAMLEEVDGGGSPSR